MSGSSCVPPLYRSSSTARTGDRFQAWVCPQQLVQQRRARRACIITQLSALALNGWERNARGAAAPGGRSTSVSETPATSLLRAKKRTFTFIDRPARSGSLAGLRPAAAAWCRTIGCFATAQICANGTSSSSPTLSAGFPLESFQLSSQGREVYDRLLVGALRTACSTRRCSAAARPV